jgi:NAD(P)H-dependent flavin oxidoreductase YrpB (nitropropane dioxygenase family)
MYTKICEDLGIEVPIFAFSHCRDVVAEVSKAGGLGVLGAGFMDAEQLREELNWIDEHIGDKPYGVDVVIPQSYVGKEEGGLTEQELEDKLWGMVPEIHLEFAENLLSDHGVPKWPEVCGQVIGQINEVESCRGVVYRLINEYIEAL